MGIAAWPLLAMTSSPGSARPSGAPSGAAAQTLPFDGGWLFGAAVPGSDQPDFDDSSFATVTLPHSVAPLSWQDWDPSDWERVWSYRKHFDAPDGLAASGGSSLEAPRVFLDFAAALTRATVTLNGTQVADHYGGYLPFSTEITSRLRNKGNLLAVTLDSTFGIDVPPDRPGQASSSVDFWQPGGVYRDVRLRAVPQIYVSDVFAQPVNVLDAASRQVKIEATVDAAVVPASDVTLTVVLTDADGGATVATATAPVTIKATGETTVDATLTGLAGVTLWDTGNPKLYTVVATLSVDGAPLHDYQTRIGFREASFTTGGFYLNGVRTKLFGLNRHQIFPFAGFSLPDRVQAKDASILREELNCNIVRCSHYPQSEAFCDAADELGLLVWEEIPGWGYFGDPSWQQAGASDLHDMIVRDRNHPSVVIWGAMPNEAGAHDAEYATYNDLAHQLDPSRPTGGDNTDSGSGYVFDVYSAHDYSSATDSSGVRWPQLEPPADPAGRPYLVCEAVGTLSGPAIYYRRTDTQFIQQGEAIAHAKVHDTAYGDDAYNGVVAWAGFDYPSGNGNQYQGIKYVGVADLFRIPKPGAAIYQSQVDPAARAVIAPAFYWDFNPQSPVTSLSQAMIASNLDQLKVYVGGSLLATVTPDKGNYGNLPYPPSFVDFSTVDGGKKPALRIDGYRGGSLASSRNFSADPSADKLSLEADDVTINADGTDATRVAFRAVDAYGNARPYVDGAVTLDMSGPGVLVGDNPLDIGPTGGVGAVWIRSLPGSPGQITVRASHPSLGTSAVTITSQAVPDSPAPVPYGSLAVSASPALVTPGSSTTVTAKLKNNGLPALTNVTFAVTVPGGWSASGTDSARVASMAPGTTATASWTIAVPSGADPGKDQVQVQAVYHGAGQRGVTHGSTSVVSSYATLQDAFGNKGISSDSDVTAANFDGVGNSYSAQALQAAGLAPGATVTHDQITFTWPDTQPGQPDNVVAQGQTVLLSGTGTTLGILGAGSPGDESGTGKVYYTDGTTSSFSVTLDNYFNPASGNDTIATLPYCNDSNAATAGGTAGKRNQPVHVFYAPAPLTAGKTVQAVTLPSGGSAPSGGRVTGLHIFALAIGPLDAEGQPISR